MAAIEKIGSYVEMLQDYIPEQYKGSARLLGLIDSMLVQCDALEDALFEILGSIDLETAIGPALDFLGAIIGVARNPGETDEAYRTRIYRFRSLKAAPTYEGIRETLSYVPVNGTDWFLTYLIRESVISDSISAISEGIIRRSIIQSLLTVAVIPVLRGRGGLRAHSPGGQRAAPGD